MFTMSDKCPFCRYIKAETEMLIYGQSTITVDISNTTPEDICKIHNFVLDNHIVEVMKLAKKEEDGKN